MANPAPVVYLLHGEDEFSIAQFVLQLEAKLGDASIAALNITRLDGRADSLNDLPSLVMAMPFLASRRLVIVAHPLARLATPAAQKKFTDQLEKIPQTTALVLIEYKTLSADGEARKAKPSPLLSWALANEGRALVKHFPTPKGPALAQWIQARAQAHGGRFTYQGAEHLAAFTGDDPRLADQEIQKALAYVAYARPVDVDDVEAVTPDVAQGDIWKMVDALGNRDGQQALAMLQRLLEEQDAISIFGMVVRQFRHLLLTRETLDRGGREAEIIREVRISPWMAGKLAFQARPFNLADLEAIYRRLLDLDEAIKTGKMEGRLALETLIAALARP